MLTVQDFLESSDDENSNSNVNSNSNSDNVNDDEDVDMNVNNSVKDWNKDDVSSWLDSVGLGNCKNIFEKEDIDGNVLLICDLNELSEHLRFIHNISFGNAARVKTAIGNLRKKGVQVHPRHNKKYSNAEIEQIKADTFGRKESAVAGKQGRMRRMQQQQHKIDANKQSLHHNHNSNSNSNSNRNETKKKSSSNNNSKKKKQDNLKKKHQKPDVNKSKEKKPLGHTTDKEQSPSHQKHNNMKKQNQSKDRNNSKNSSKKRDYEMECHNDKSFHFDAPPKKKQRNSMSTKENNDNQLKLRKSKKIFRRMSKIVQNVEMSRVDTAKLLKNLKQTFERDFGAFKTRNGQIRVDETANGYQFLFSSFAASITIDSDDVVSKVQNKTIIQLFGGDGADVRLDTHKKDGQTISFIRWMKSDYVSRNNLIHQVNGLRSPSIKVKFKAFYDNIDPSQVSTYVSSYNTATGEGKLTVQGFVFAALIRYGICIQDDELTNVIKQSYRTT